MKKSTIIAVTLCCAAIGSEMLPGSIAPGGVFFKDAQARVGRPLTPISVAGVARRTTRRAIIATSIYVATLPPSCSVVMIEGMSLHQCGGTYYQPSGNQYVVVNVN